MAADTRADAGAPIRVVVFTGGPRLGPGVRRFLLRLEEEADIEVLAALCQSPDQSPGAVVRDLWRRRRLLAVPLVVMMAANRLLSTVRRPRGGVTGRRALAGLADRLVFVPDLHAQEVCRQVAELDPDLGLIYGAPFLKPELFEIPRHGTLGIHHGEVPKYRGKKTTFWAMLEGEETAGVTIQRVTAGLDRGDVVRSGRVPIGRRTLRSVWNELEDLGLDLYIAAIRDVGGGTAVFQPQPAGPSRLYRDPRPADILRFWWRWIVRRLEG